MYEELREAVCAANRTEARRLIVYRWGSVSRTIAAGSWLSPSGVSYAALTPENMVVVDLDGRVVEGDLRPSSDTATHLELYRAFEMIGGVCHTHSPKATMWAQACRPISCFGTTHAEYYYGPVPVTEPMTEAEIRENYELNTGKVIVRRFGDLDPGQVPAVLVANHGPFTWGPSAAARWKRALCWSRWRNGAGDAPGIRSRTRWGRRCWTSIICAHGDAPIRAT